MKENSGLEEENNVILYLTTHQHENSHYRGAKYFLKERCKKGILINYNQEN